MSVREALAARRDELTGYALSPIERSRLQGELPSLSEDATWLLDLLTEFAVAGTTFELDEEHDKSGLGVEMKWMSGAEMMEEAKVAYPGRVVAPLGYVPVGICLVGSGDPYFVSLRSGELVRVPHDAVMNDSINHSSIEVVCESLSAFFECATIE